MRRVRSAVQAFALVVVAAGCYHATVDTGLAPSPTVIDQPWALGFVYGLVPPSPLETIARCPKGVAKVETELGFLNAVVANLTLGILTPMHLRVTCALDGTTRASAPGSRVLDLGRGAGPDALRTGLARAADLAVETGQPVILKY